MDTLKKEIVQALNECYGIVKDACRKAGVPRSTYYSWLKDDPEFKLLVEETQEEAIDFVEGKLFEKINGVAMAGEEGNVYYQPPSDTAIIFYLKTKAKKRGYVERQEIAGVDGRPLIWREERTYQVKENGLLNGLQPK